MSQEEINEQKVQEATDDPPQQEEAQQEEQIIQQEQVNKEEQLILQDQQQAEDRSSPILIQVKDPTEKGSGMSKYIVYTLKGRDALGEFEVQRRFNEFYVLRETLLSKWPGQYIPPIPDKQMSVNQEAINERVRLLNIFCMKMTQIKYLYYAEEFATVFLRSTQQDIAKQLSSIPKSNVQAQIQKYQETFEIQEVVEPPAESISKMNAMQTFLRRSQTLLIKLYEQSKQLSASRRVLRDSLYNIVGTHLQEYERSVLTECVKSNKNLVFLNPDAQELVSLIAAQKDNIMNPLDKIQDLITTEQRDLDAFLQAFQTRDQVLTQKQKIEAKLRDEQSELSGVMAGKKPLFGKLSLEETKQKLELQMMETQKEVDFFKKYYQLVTMVLTNKQISKFREDKHESYKTIIRDLAQLEIEQNIKSNQMWTALTGLIEQANNENE